MPDRSSLPCPCGRDATYAECCGALHEGRATASTAEQLMRSRYSAFVTRNGDYLYRTWSTKTRPPRVDFATDMRYTGLEILSTTDGSPFHTEGTVEFRAHYTLTGHPHTHHEHSTFARENGEWVYVTALPD